MKIGFLTIMLGLIGLAIVANVQYQIFNIMNENHHKEWGSIIYNATTGFKILAGVISFIGLVIGIIGVKNKQRLSRIGVILNLISIILIIIPIHAFFY